MIEQTILPLFITASALLSISPGPDNLFVLSQSIVHGKKAGLVIVLGLCTGLLAHTLLVSMGLAVIIQTSPILFTLIKYTGAAYLLYLGITYFIKISQSNVNNTCNTPSFGSLYRRGFIMNLTNPKVAVFFIAFLPQFINETKRPVSSQMALLGLLFILVAFLIFALICVLAGSLGNVFNKSKPGGKLLNLCAGAVLCLLAIKLIGTTISQ